MKTGLSLEAFAAKITATAQSARDFIMPAPTLRMTPAGEFAWTAGAEGMLLPANKIATAQVATYCGIPRDYFDRCPTGLRATNVNHWLDAQPKDKRLVRTADGCVRAFLSDRYRPLDNYDLAAHVLPIVSELGLKVISADVTDTKLYLKCVNERVQGEVSKGDIVQAGVIIQNSETGHGSLSVTSFILRLVCMNGMVSDRSSRKYHIGDKRKGDDLTAALEVYCDETRKKMDSALWAQVGDMTRTAVSEALFEQIVQKMRDATQGPAIVAPIAACEVLRKRFSLTEIESTGILGHLAAGGDLSRFGMLNAVTRYAQDVESYDRSTELERLGGTILDLAASEWKAMAV